MSDEYKAICEKGLNELYSLRAELSDCRRNAARMSQDWHADRRTMREVAEELRREASFDPVSNRWCFVLADRLDAPTRSGEPS